MSALNQNYTSHDKLEELYRKKSLHHSFMGNLYNALGGAAFIGLLGTIAKGLVEVAMGGDIGAKAWLMFAPAPLAVMAGLMVVGTACVYLANREYTERSCLGDEHLAYVQARQKVQEFVHDKAPEVVVLHEQNIRADGKKWQNVVKAPSAPQLLPQGT